MIASACRAGVQPGWATKLNKPNVWLLRLITKRVGLALQKLRINGSVRAVWRSRANREVRLTIAACYVSPEGVIFGADSTTTYNVSPHPFVPGRGYNYGQKIFEIGEGGTLAAVTWGLGGLEGASYRTLLARLSDTLVASPLNSVFEVAERWIDQFWSHYSNSLALQISYVAVLSLKNPHDPAKPNGDVNTRSISEEYQLQQLSNNLVVGFCLGGYLPSDREPEAYQIIFDPVRGKPTPQKLPVAQSFWGVPALITRLINGCADEVVEALMLSGKWNGSRQELETLIKPHKLVHPATVPIREAIDFTHACLLTTIKAIKFSSIPRVCGGPVEIAVITTDRSFRWVRHKSWDAAIREDDHGQ